MRTEIELNNGWRFAKIYNLGISENDAVTPELSKYSEEIGVDGLLIVTPYYNKTTQNRINKAL